ncbi:hypothetical protein DOTSEDRAFT_166880 [Dothistroma septosporum NZE10]|uniref:AAA+ ATPase domain-containing protein n=1 Tax=Dothistroma septosporum (strain NZE10 / CBS 128990) TaxID=675120 RepID=N1PW97_DOTSN|nr:hypothetical protein DOTSEDRAFT_166880 [Dothistroma septosporum NZE10]
MAGTAVLPAMNTNGEKNVHPFFTKPDTTYCHSTITHQRNEDFDCVANEAHDETQNKPKRTTSKRRQKNGDQCSTKGKTQRTLGEIVNGKDAAPAAAEEVINVYTSEPNLNTARQKRRHTNEHEAAEFGASTAVEEAELPRSPRKRSSSPRVIIPASSPLPTKVAANMSHMFGGMATPETNEAVLESATPQRKVLRLNANGKFSSPPIKKTKNSGEPKPEAPKRRGRKRTSVVTSYNVPLVVVCRYGEKEGRRQEIGKRIDRILQGAEIITMMKPKTTPKKRITRQPKATHPFFAGKQEDAAPPEKESPRKASAVTPGKLRVKAFSDRIRDPKETHIFHSALLRDRHMVKHVGSKEAPFPDKEQAHVRDVSELSSMDRVWNETLRLRLPSRKRKQAEVRLRHNESILARFTAALEPEADRQLRQDGFREPDASLNLPQKLLMSGEEIAEQIKRHLSVVLVGPSQDEVSTGATQHAQHPSLQNLYDKIPTTLTAFDESKGEVLQWTQKYAPSCCAEILQSDKEMAVLRTWLTSLAVQAVGGAAITMERVAKAEAAERPKKKRKKKPHDLDDFLVDSDDDSRDMSELADLDHSAEFTRAAPKSIVQVAQTGAKFGNAVLLSGPHGCGKTAAAYAVAREMGYKVFEISPSERRSGRDILDKIGDMTENHLVKHHGTDSVDLSDNEGPTRMDEAFQEDLESGRQGKMMSFFKPKAQRKPKPAEPRKVVKEKTVKAVQDAIKRRPKEQQQSLILLEEVDILFKDDKEFWTTILKLITTSKRPFIMTCNDEDLVPLQALSLHAILRFTQPPVDLATDYMLLLAAAEGHLLERPAVNSLYQYHHCDLRASISELDYWCQMGIGDPRGGLSWIYQRWPPGSDVDERGRRLRVVSEGTYRLSMGQSQSSSAEGCLSFESAEEPPSSVFDWEQLLLARNPWPADPRSQLQTLSHVATIADTFSAADVFCSMGLAASENVDPTQPAMPDKARGNYIEGIALLQTDERIDCGGMSTDLLLATNLAARRALGAPADSRDSVNNGSRRTARQELPLGRRAFSCFDAISMLGDTNAAINPGLTQSAFDGPLNIIATDLAPYVRSIVQYDQVLEEQRDRLNLLMTDGRKAKRVRTTRAARSALEGGLRSTTRREKWFSKDLDFHAVLATGGHDWPRASSAPPSATGSADIMSQNSADVPPGGMEAIQYEG